MMPLVHLLKDYFRKTFMENIKSCKKKLVTFFFSHKKFLKLVLKPIPLEHS